MSRPQSAATASAASSDRVVARNTRAITLSPSSAMATTDHSRRRPTLAGGDLPPCDRPSGGQRPCVVRVAVTWRNGATPLQGSRTGRPWRPWPARRAGAAAGCWRPGRRPARRTGPTPAVRRGGQTRPACPPPGRSRRSEEHTSELQSRVDLVCRLLLEKKKKQSLSFLFCRIEVELQVV